MHIQLALVLALVSGVTFAGCANDAASSPGPDFASRPALSDGKGAIMGLVIDDRYRPVPEALVLLTPLGHTTTTDALGQFAFADLAPGSFALLVQADAHEAAPTSADVRSGEYTEIEIEARRTFSGSSDLITTEYSIFIPCAVSAVIITAIMDCLVDFSGDSYRAGFSADFTKYGKNATYLVIEFRASQADGYYIPVGGCGKAYNGGTFHGEYNRYLMVRGNATPDHPKGSGYDVWKNDCKDVGVVVFYVGAADDTFKRYLGTSWGAGARLAVKATFLNSLFIGEPQVDIDTYGPLRPPGQ